MTSRAIVVAVFALAVLAAPAAAQEAKAPKSSGAAQAPLQPALASLVGARGADLGNAGVQRIAARTGMNRRDIQFSTRWGTSTIAWPANLKPVTFQIDVGAGNAVTVRAAGDVEKDRAAYAAAFDALIPRAITVAQQSRQHAERIRP